MRFLNENNIIDVCGDLLKSLYNMLVLFSANYSSSADSCYLERMYLKYGSVPVPKKRELPYEG